MAVIPDMVLTVTPGDDTAALTLYIIKLQEQLVVADEQIKVACNRAENYKAALGMIAQCRHVSGSAQGAFRSNLMIADAALAGAEMSDPVIALKVAEGKWRPA